MKKLVGVTLVLVMLLSILNITYAEDYLLGPGDVIAIGVLGFDELQVKDLTVRNDGKIAFPIVGEVQAGGLSPGQLTKVITAGISRYTKDPQVTINVLKFRTTRIYVLGEVAKPGLYELEKQHTLLDAIGVAGGYTKDALKKKVYIIRKDSTNKPVAVNLLRLLREGDMSQNYLLHDGDAVYLAPNGRIDISRDILPFISLAAQIADDD